MLFAIIMFRIIHVNRYSKVERNRRDDDDMAKAAPGRVNHLDLHVALRCWDFFQKREKKNCCYCAGFIDPGFSEHLLIVPFYLLLVFMYLSVCFDISQQLSIPCLSRNLSSLLHSFLLSTSFNRNSAKQMPAWMEAS